MWKAPKSIGLERGPARRSCRGPGPGRGVEAAGGGAAEVGAEDQRSTVAVAVDEGPSGGRALGAVHVGRSSSTAGARNSIGWWTRSPVITASSPARGDLDRHVARRVARRRDEADLVGQRVVGVDEVDQARPRPAGARWPRSRRSRGRRPRRSTSSPTRRRRSGSGRSGRRAAPSTRFPPTWSKWRWVQTTVSMSSAAQPAASIELADVVVVVLDRPDGRGPGRGCGPTPRRGRRRCRPGSGGPRTRRPGRASDTSTPASSPTSPGATCGTGLAGGLRHQPPQRDVPGHLRHLRDADVPHRPRAHVCSIQFLRRWWPKKPPLGRAWAW